VTVRGSGSSAGSFESDRGFMERSLPVNLTIFAEGYGMAVRVKVVLSRPLSS
jgi:hypothetical protein